MQAVALSSKFQVVIPKKVRESLSLVAGQKIQIIAYDNRIEMIPVCPLADMIGFVEGIDTSFDREEDRL
ncbi:AbrB/MazE/SpoVT family DNA-binding domain-containing protein [Geobacter argillaceus]|uniref:AbrB family looped-hinge helix DNA binding protein n=1 Tax=Geobacter argillaceus TaxID=345631 RepID=A0A562VHS3_9BACT|nr:AbrB/MazE/SpoVT family DNA-binding domain-containing protein [Geobacter argillaceus]TWJ17334.1 AbrB family looped-hinge helix DNA binding protein [Geobacter argillaceus]